MYLLAHSWGSYIGLQAVALAPERYAAYIGVGRSCTRSSPSSSPTITRSQYSKKLATGRLRTKLRSAPPGHTAPLPRSYMALRERYMHQPGIGTMRDMNSVITGIFLPSLIARDYTLIEKVNLWRGKVFSGRSDLGLWDTMLTTDMRATVPSIDIPVHFIRGRHDYTGAYPLAHDYFNRIDAPHKRFYILENRHTLPCSKNQHECSRSPK